MRNDKCDWCQNTGLITVYHREFRGSPDVFEEERKVPGTIAVHCDCALGRWMRERTAEEIKERIPTLQDVLESKIPYLLERLDMEYAVTNETEAKELLAKLRRGEMPTRKAPPVPSKSTPEQIHNDMRDRAMRNGEEWLPGDIVEDSPHPESIKVHS